MSYVAIKGMPLFYYKKAGCAKESFYIFSFSKIIPNQQNNPGMEEENLNIELTKILGKVMQSSYKKKEVSEIVERIINKVESKIVNRYDDAEIKSLRMEFEEIRKSFYDL